MVIEGREWPLGFLLNAVLGPEYSCTDIHLIEDSESPIHVFEHCRSQCVFVGVHGCIWVQVR